MPNDKYLKVFLLIFIFLLIFPSISAAAGTLAINGGALYTNSTSVTLNLTYPATTFQLDIQELPSGAVTSVAPASTVGFTLSPGDGTKTVRVTSYYTYTQTVCPCGKYNIWGICTCPQQETKTASEEYTASIVLDTSRPSGTFEINGGAAFTNSTAVILNISGLDNYQVARMRFGNSTSIWSPDEAYASLKSWSIPPGDGYKTVYCQLMDAAGNWSDVISSWIFLDATPPASSITAPASGSFFPPGHEITISGTAGDSAGSGIKKVEVSTDGGRTWMDSDHGVVENSGGSWAKWLYAFMPSAEGTYSIKARATDFANKVETSPQGISIIVDSTKPSSSIDGFTWKKVNKTAAASIAVSPDFENDHTVFAGTLTNGILKSEDSSLSWSDANSGLADLKCRVIALSPNYAADKTIFAVMESGIFKSADGGSSWVEGGVLPGPVLALAISPDGTVFAGTAGGGIFKSLDGGNTWNQLSSGMENLFISAIGISDKTIFAYGTNPDGSAPALYKSEDGGGTWGVIDTGNSITGIAISPSFASDGSIFIGTENGVLKSTDGGATWTSCSSGLTGSAINALTISRDKTLFAALPEGIFKSVAGSLLVNGVASTITGNASDNGSGVRLVEISTDGGNTWAGATDTSGGTWKTWSYSWSIPADGAYNIKSRATDIVGNMEDAGAGITAIVDNTPPASVISSPVPGAVISGQEIVITGTTADGAGSGVKKVQVQLSGSVTWTDAVNTSADGSWSTWSCKLPIPSDGSCQIKARGIDYLSNIESPSVVNITVDNAMPSSTITQPGEAIINGAVLTVAGTAADNSGLGIKKVQVLSPLTAEWTDALDSSGNGSWSSWSFSTAMPADGRYFIQSRAMDNSGNIEIPGHGISITVDNKKPTGGISINNDARYTDQTSVSLTLSGDDISGIPFMRTSGDGLFDAVPWENFAAYRNWTLTAGDGEKTVYAQFMDAAGNISDIFSSSILLDTVSPAAAITAPMPSEVLCGQNYNITGTAWDGGSGIDKVEISFGDGQWTAVSGTANWNYSWALPVSGKFTISARATDRAGNVSATSSVRVSIDNISPVTTEPEDNASRPAAYTLPPDFPDPPMFKWAPNACANFKIYFSDSPDFKQTISFTSDNHGISPTFSPGSQSWNRITKLGRDIYWKVSGRDAQKDTLYSICRKLILDGGFKELSEITATDVSDIPVMKCNPGENSSLLVQFSAQPDFKTSLNSPKLQNGSPATYEPPKTMWSKITKLTPAYFWRFTGKLSTGETAFSETRQTSVTGGPFIISPSADYTAEYAPVITWDPSGFTSCAVQAGGTEDFRGKLLNIGVSKTGSLAVSASAWNKIKAYGSTFYIRIIGTTSEKYTAYGGPIRLFISQ